MRAASHSAIQRVISAQASRLSLTKGQVADWFEQFDDHEIELAIVLLRNLRYISKEECIKGFDHIARTLASQGFHDALLFPLGPIGKSGAGVVHQFSKHTQFPKNKIRTFESLNTKRPADDSRMVLMDDFAGTGDQAIRLIAPIMQSRKQEHVALCFLCATYGAERKIKDAYPNTSFITWDRATNAFDSNLFSSERETDEARQMCTRIGRILSPGMPLGYKDDALLLAFHNNCPNNTLPIFWSNGAGRFKWKPLFPTPQPVADGTTAPLNSAEDALTKSHHRAASKVEYPIQGKSSFLRLQRKILKARHELVAELVFGDFKLLSSLPLWKLRVTRRDDSRATSCESLARELAKDIGSPPELEKFITKALESTKFSEATLASNLLCLLGAVRGSLDGAIVPQTSGLVVDLRGISAVDADFSMGQIAETLFTISLSNISAVTFGQSRENLFVADSQGAVGHFEWRRSKPLWIQQVHHSWVRCLVFDRNRGRLYSAGEDERISVLSDRDGTSIAETIRTPGRSWCSTIRPDGTVFLGCDGGYLLVINPRSLKVIQQRVCDSTIEALCYDTYDGTIYAGSVSGKIIAIDDEGRAPRVIADVAERIRFISAEAGTVLAGCQDGGIRMINTVAPDKHPAISKRVHQQEVRFVHVNCGKDALVLSAGRDGEVVLSDKSLNEVLRCGGYTGGIRAGAICEGTVAFAYSEVAEVVEADTIFPIGYITGQLIETWGVTSTPSAIFVGLENGSLLLIDPQSMNAVNEITRAHGRRIRSIAASPDNRFIATGGSDRQVHLWRVNGLDVTHERALPITRPGLRSLVFLSTDELLIGAGDGCLYTYSLGGREVTRRIFTNQGEILGCLPLRASGEILALGTDKSVRRFSLRGEETYPPLHLDTMPSGVAHHSDRFIFIGLADGRIVAIDDHNRPSICQHRHADSVSGLIAVDGFLYSTGADGWLIKWRILDGAPYLERESSIAINHGAINGLAIHVPQRALWTPCSDGTVVASSLDSLDTLGKIPSYAPYKRLKISASSLTGPQLHELQKLGAIIK